MEKLVLSLAADFRGKSDLILPVINAFQHRQNETFRKVFGTYLKDIKDDLNYDKFLIVLDFLDKTGGEQLFAEFVDRYFVQEQFIFKDDIHQAICLARIFIKQGV